MYKSMLKNFLKKALKEKYCVKSISLIVSLALVFTSISSNIAYAMPVATVMPVVKSIPTNKFVVPFNIGRITDALYNGKSEEIIINIQDLHSHEQTQRNISSILSILDKNYGIDKIYVEGAIGKVDTSWISNIADKDVKAKVVNNLLKSGRLTGSELYAIESGKDGILEGIEDKEVYLKNVDRLNEIYNKKLEIEEFLPKIKYVLEQSVKKYYSEKNLRINRIIKKNKNGKISTSRYFKYIIKWAEDAGIDINRYSQIKKFIEVIVKQEELKTELVNKEVGKILEEIKSKITYAQYKNLTQKINNKEQETEFYNELKKISEQECILEKYQNATKFFNYIQLNEGLNPLQLVNEEKNIIKEIQDRNSQTVHEKEVYFLSRYIDLVEGYLSNKMAADEYAYFVNNKNRFEFLWKKYVDIDGLIDVEKYFGLFEEFYKNNVERNRIFLEKIIGKKVAKEIEGIRIKGSVDNKEKIVEQINNGKKIKVVITGGFHTYGFTKLLEDNGVDYCVITPNITEETLTAEQLYENVFKEQYKLQNQTFQKMLVSQVVDLLKKGAIKQIEVQGENVLINYENGDKIELNKIIGNKEIKDDKKVSKDNAEKIAEIFAENFFTQKAKCKENREQARQDAINILQSEKNTKDNFLALPENERYIEGGELWKVGWKETFRHPIYTFFDSIGFVLAHYLGKPDDEKKLLLEYLDEYYKSYEQYKKQQEEQRSKIKKKITEKNLLYTIETIINDNEEQLNKKDYDEQKEQKNINFNNNEKIDNENSPLLNELPITQSIKFEDLIGSRLKNIFKNISKAIKKGKDIKSNDFREIKKGLEYLLEMNIDEQQKGNIRTFLPCLKLYCETYKEHSLKHKIEEKFPGFFKRLEGARAIRLYSWLFFGFALLVLLIITTPILYQQYIQGLLTATKVIVAICVDVFISTVVLFAVAVYNHNSYNSSIMEDRDIKQEKRISYLLKLPNDLQSLKSSIEEKNKKGIDIKDENYKKQLEDFIDLLIKYHSDEKVKNGEATDEKGNQIDYWDEQACDIFKKNVLEYAKQQRDIISKSNTKGTGLKIGENFFPMDNNKLKGSVSQKEFFQKLGIIKLDDILNKKEEYLKFAKKINFLNMQLNGGAGSSVERTRWLKCLKLLNDKLTERQITPKEYEEALKTLSFLDVSDKELQNIKVELGAKAADMYFIVNVGTKDNPQYKLMSITDIKLSELLKEKREGKYASVSVVMLTSLPSKGLIKKSYEADGNNIKEQINSKDGKQIIEILGDEEIAEDAMMLCGQYPPVYMEGNILKFRLDKEAPSGHGVWLKTILEKIAGVKIDIKEKEEEEAIICISNSDALNSGTPVEIPGYMVNNNKGIMVIAATREQIDRKGGIIGLKKIEVYGKQIFIPCIMEIAQAKATGQEQLFQEMGFGKYEGQVAFNTNTVLINVKKMKALMNYLKKMIRENKITQEEYDKMALPDLIKNGKGKDNKEYYQLEGALVSAVFNLNERIEILRRDKNKGDLNEFMNKNFPNGLVGIALANKSQRTQIFTPFKFAVDAWIQFNGTIDTNTYMWKTNSVIDGATGATNVSVPQEGVYKDISFFLKYWRNCDIKGLKNLYINSGVKRPDLQKQGGIVKMKDVILKGDVTIINATNEELLINSDLLQQCDFKMQDNKIILEDVKIEVYRIDNKIKLKITKKGYDPIVYEAQQLITKDFFNETKSYIYVLKKADDQTKELALSNPTITVSDYADNYYAAEYFRDCIKKDLKKLSINPGLKNRGGIVKMKDVILKGDVTIINATDQDLLIKPRVLDKYNFGFNKENGKIILEDVKIEAYEQGDEIMLKITKTGKKEQIYKTELISYEEFGITKQYISPYIVKEGKLVVEKAKQWLELSWNKIKSIFKKDVSKIVAVVDVNDEQAIDEALNYARNGVKVELIFVGQKEEIGKTIIKKFGRAKMPTKETSTIYGTNNLSFELKNSYIKNLEIRTYELVSGGEIKLLDTVNNIIEGLDSKNKNIMYVSKNLLDTSIENLKSIEKLNSAIYDKTLLAYSTDSIKVAMVKGITALKGISNKALSNMTVKTKNIMATYSVPDIRKTTFEQDLNDLLEKGINTIILKVGIYDIKTEEINFFRDKGINVLYKIEIKDKNLYELNGLLSKEISKDNIIIDFKNVKKEDLKEIIEKLNEQEKTRTKFIYNSHNLPESINKNDVKLMLDYKNAIEMIKKGEKINDGSIVYISPQDGENIVVSTKDIKNLVNVGVSLAFDAQVINDIDSQDISKDGITMLEIIKSMFSQTPKAKLAREKVEGKIKGREFALNKEVSNENLQKMYYAIKFDNTSNKNYLTEILEKLTGIKAKNQEQAKATLTGIIEVNELKKLIDISVENLRDDILSENADKLLEMLGEYRVLAGKSFTREYGEKIVSKYNNQSMDEILGRLERQLKTVKTQDEKLRALAGIIYILLDDRLKIKEYKERIIDMDINQIKAMLTAA